MWSYEKHLEYPINIKTPSPATAKIIVSQLGGPHGELGAATRYLSQRFAMPVNEVKAILTDVGTEELAHIEMISTIMQQPNKNTPVFTIGQVIAAAITAKYWFFFSSAL